MYRVGIQAVWRYIRVKLIRIRVVPVFLLGNVVSSGHDKEKERRKDCE